MVIWEHVWLFFRWLGKLLCDGRMKKNINNIHGKELTCKIFKTPFKRKFMLDRYYDEKAKEFNDLRLGQLTMEEFVTKFVNLQCYVPYMKDENEKVY